MGIFIKNVETVRKARALAERRGAGLTATIDQALDLLEEQDRANLKPERTLESMIAATERFRKAAGITDDTPPITKADFDALYDYLDEEIDGRR
jgi:hypothetical protein